MAYFYAHLFDLNVWGSSGQSYYTA